MNIKRQSVLMYLYEAALAFRMVDAVWVIFLLERGFSLAEVGTAEGVYHITSMLFGPQRHGGGSVRQETYAYPVRNRGYVLGSFYDIGRF